MVLRASADEARSIVKGSEYGLNVIAFIGERQIHDRKSFHEIHDELTEHGVSISGRHVPNLFRLYLAILGARTLGSQPVQARLKAQGRVILSCDAVKFDDVSPRLYVARDILSEEILAAKRIEKADTATLVAFMTEVKVNLDAAGVTVAGAVSDKEQALMAAIEIVFPGVPQQYCQAHYLGHVVAPMDSDLAQLGAAVEKVAKEVRDLSGRLDALKAADPGERALAKKMCEAVRVSSKRRGDKLLDPPALKRFNALAGLEDMTRRATQKKVGDRVGLWPLLARLLAVLSYLSTFKEVAARLSRQMAVVHHIAHLLNLEVTGEEVRTRLDTYLKELEQQVSAGTIADTQARFYEQVIAVTRRYWKGLFACYDVEGLPRNNNALESFFRTLKWHLRRVGGKKSTAGGIFESFAPLLVQLWPEMQRRRDLQVLFEGLTPEELQVARQGLQELAEPARERRSFIRDPEAQLQSALDSWYAN